MSRRTAENRGALARRRKIASIVGTVGFVLMLVAVQVLTASSIWLVVAGWIFLAWGVGAAGFALRELWLTRKR